MPSEAEGRRHERVPLRIEVALEHGNEVLHTHSRNVGVGGMFLETSTPLPHGAPVSLRFRLPGDSQESCVEGVVRWVSAEGVGVQFGPLRARQVWSLNRALERARQ